MSKVQITPLTIHTALSAGGNTSEIVMGSNRLSFNTTPNSYWLLIVDRTDLSVVANVNFTDNSSVPAEMTKYSDTKYFMILTTYGIQSNSLPQGAFAKALYTEGADTELARAEQIYEALNCGQYGHFAYTYVAIMGDPTTNGFETFGLTQDTVTTLSLQGLDIGGSTLWTPSSIITPNS